MLAHNVFNNNDGYEFSSDEDKTSMSDICIDYEYFVYNDKGNVIVIAVED